MSVAILRDAIRRLINTHPDIRPSLAGHAGYIERYRSARRGNIGLETRGERHQNLFVETAHIDLSVLADIPHTKYFAANYEKSKPNSNLFHPDAFRTVDIVRFKITELTQAQRVISEVTR